MLKNTGPAEPETEDGYVVLWRDSEDSPCDPCPFCGKEHIHGKGDGHRSPHCVEPKAAYIRGQRYNPGLGYIVRTRKVPLGGRKQTQINRTPISGRTRFKVFERDRFTCRYCGRSAPKVQLEIDHVLAVAKGGGNDIENLVTSCRECNGSKGVRDVDAPPADSFDEPVLGPGMDGLVDLFCFRHTPPGEPEEGRIQYQGKVLRTLGGGSYLVQLFSWLDGTPNGARIFDIDGERDLWTFYATVEDWHFAYEQECLRYRGRN